MRLYKQLSVFIFNIQTSNSNRKYLFQNYLEPVVHYCNGLLVELIYNSRGLICLGVSGKTLVSDGSDEKCFLFLVKMINTYHSYKCNL